MSEAPRRPKKPTATTKAHRFEPFTKRIAKIKIDPVHTVQKSRMIGDHNDFSKSFFRSGLDEWAELNLSRTFTSFLNKASPLSESLPQLLHHSDRIFALLVEHIEKKEELSLEPLLSLLAHLAHDLGPEFHEYFARAVACVAQVSASIEDPAAIESCFTCLAWMFKYMSKVLVQDMRPLLEIMIPYMSSKKDFVRRFSAESLAFLVRKTAALYSKKPKSLDVCLQYLFEQSRVRTESMGLASYKTALMTLITESALSIDWQLHSSATDLVACAFETVESMSITSNDQIFGIMEGIVINLVHRTHAAGFRPVIELIVSKARQSSDDQALHTQFFRRLLFVAITTRKGSRVQNWADVIEVLLADLAPKIEDDALLKLYLSAAVIQYTPMDQLLPYLNRVLDQTTDVMTPVEYFAFCELVADSGRERFQDLLLPRLQKFIVAHWKSDETGLCYLLERLHQKGLSSRDSRSQCYTALPIGWETAIVQRLREAKHETGLAEDCSPYFQLADAVHFPKDEKNAEQYNKLLLSSAHTALEAPGAELLPSTRLTLGWSFQSYLNTAAPSVAILSELWERISKLQQNVMHLGPFLEACATVLAKLNSDTFQSSMAENVLPYLCGNMLSDDIHLRETTIRSLLSVGQLTRNKWLVETSELLLEILGTSYSPSTSRQLEMLIRRLPAQQLLTDSQSSLRRLVPLFTLGMLRHYHDQTRRGLCSALSQMVAGGNVEDIVVEIVMKWLQTPGLGDASHGKKKEDETFTRLTPFECSNVNMVTKQGSEKLLSHSNAEAQLKSMFQEAHELHPPRTPVDSRSLALQVLLALPETSERRSRTIIPVFLSISSGKTNQHAPQSDESTSSHTVSPEIDEQVWSLRDRKTFLELVSKFINPKVLYRSREVYDSLLELLTNGNAEVRKLALIALFNWKTPSVQHYQDVLVRVAEEKSATTELALLLSDNEDSGSIKPDDRSTVLLLLLRLVFGQLIGRSTNHGSQEAKRKSILRLLFRMKEDETKLFLNIAQGRLRTVSDLTSHTEFPLDSLNQDIVSTDQQYGFLRMMLSMLEILQSQFSPYGNEVMASILYCTARACRLVNTSPDDGDSHSATALVRNTRRTGLQCLNLLFENCHNIDLSFGLKVVFLEIVSPRLTTFAIETAQGISALLRLFSTWSKSARLMSLLRDHDSRLLGTLWEVLEVPSARNDVKLFVLEDILAPIVELSGGDLGQTNIAAEILSAQVDHILSSMTIVMQGQPSKELLLAATRLVPRLATFTATTSAANGLLSLLITLLCEPSQRIPPHIKGSLLQATESLLRLRTVEVSGNTISKLYDVIAAFYSYFKDQPNRANLGRILILLNQDGKVTADAIRLCEDLNSQSTKHLDEVDYEKRLAAFNAINERAIEHGTRRQWLPLLHNLLYFARTDDDFAIRSNAVNCLKRYVAEACHTQNSETRGLVRGTLLPAFTKGTRQDSELVRADFVALYGLVVKHLQDAPELQDLKVLLVGNDEEASFFTNILHIQQHRRLRAIRRLVTEVEAGNISSTNVSEFCLPLLDKFINDESTDESAQGVRGQSIAATAILLQWIDWKGFRRIFRQYRQDLMSGSRPEKDSIKLLNNASDALTSAIERSSSDEMQTDDAPRLVATLPQADVVRDELKTNFIPKLAEFIHHKDEAQISLRIPAAQITVKLIKLLAPEEIPILVAPILLDISQILRSRTQESRDIARNTLAGIVELMGPSSVQFVLKELRTTLTRGYQLHVLSYTMHTILLAGSPHYQTGDLDYCVDELVSVVMDDIFGATGQEKESQDYISSMREVKSSKSFDSMEHLAKSTSIQAMSKLIEPFRSLLTGNLSTKQVKQVDELLRRLGVGIGHNSVASSRDLLLFAYELIQSFYKQKANPQAAVRTHAEKNRQRYLIQLESAHKTNTASSSTLLFKLARFALDIVRSTMLKHPALMTVENVHGFLPVIGDALIEAQEDVKISALRLLSAVIKLPITELDKNASLYVMQAVKVVKDSMSTNEEAAQAALKLVTAVLRERREVEVRESDISYLLHRTMPDLEEPDRQGVTFNFIKAVMARKYELPDVYELVDKLGIMMITSQTRNSRDAARGVYVHFLLEYPQSKNRWTKQLKFLVKNLEFQYPEGRQSVMEAIHILLQKIGSEMAQELVSNFFLPIVLRMANDDNAACREMAGALLSNLYRKADQSQFKSLLEPLRGWIDQSENSALTKLSMQAWKILVETGSTDAEPGIPLMRSAILRTLEGVQDDNEEEDWELPFYALELLQALVVGFPSSVMAPKQKQIWLSVNRSLRSKHTWIQSAAASLLGKFFQDCMTREPTTNALVSSYGLKFETEMVLTVLRYSMRVLKRNDDSQDLASKTLQNLLLLGRYADSNNLTMKVKETQVSTATSDLNDEGADGLSEGEDEDVENNIPMKSIAALQYMLDQCVYILRREPNKLTTSAFLPRLSALSLLTALLPQLSASSLPRQTTIALMIPLSHITDPNVQPPRSADTTFPQTYTDYTASSHALLEAIQNKLGDEEYVRLMTDVSRVVRQRREGRRQKRAIERVTEPERAAKYKKRKEDRKKDRKKEVKDLYRKKRRGDLGF